MTDAAYVTQYLSTLGQFGVKPGLERISSLLHRSGNPHRRFKVIHVAGSNGKGSTASMVAAGLQRSGRRTGLYTSPHLMQYNERIRVDGAPITDGALRRLVNCVEPIVDAVASELGSPTEFDVGTALAFLHFANEDVDIAVIETGLGGRWDSTNVVDPILSIITPITRDHPEVLGMSVDAIAREKAGIIKKGRPVVIAPQPSEVRHVLLQRAAAMDAPLVQVVCADKSKEVTEHPVDTYTVQSWGERGGAIVMHYADGQEADYSVGMLGYHQLQNAAVSASALHLLESYDVSVSDEAIRHALGHTQVAGRLEIVHQRPRVFLDGAHNKLGAEQLAKTLIHAFPNRWVTLVCGISKDKPAEEILRPLVPLASRVVTTQATASRLGAWGSDQLVDIISAMHCNNVTAEPMAGAALQRALKETPDDGIICVMGSLYLVGEVRSLLTRSALQ